MIAPVHAATNVSAKEVTMGGEAARRTYLFSTSRSFSPFARAAKTKSSSMTWRTRFRVVYDQEPKIEKATAMAGSTMCHSMSL